MTGEVKILYGERVGTPDDGYAYIPTVAQIGVRENCEIVSVLIIPTAQVMDAQKAGIPMRDLMHEICLN